MSMSQHPVQPRSSAGTMPLTPFVLLGAVWGVIVLAWLAWAWGAVGLLLTAAAALPGAAGWLARLLQGALLPAGARHAAAVALGLTVALQGPLAAATAFADTATTAPAVPDWPAGSPDATGTPAPTPAQQPGTPSTAAHVVVRGDCLWDIASAHLRTAGAQPPSTADVAGAVSAWWSENRTVIGDDPDLLLPGQVLTPPATR